MPGKEGKMLEQCSEAAKRVVNQANRETLPFGHGYIGTGHLLLALIKNAEGVAELFLLCEVDPQAIQDKVLELLQATEVKGGRVDQLYFTPRAQKVLLHAMKVATDLKQAEVHPAHLAIALLSVEDGKAAETFRELGFNPGDLAERLVEWLKPPNVDST